MESRGDDTEVGNGFFVHVPGAKRKFILTAGHNLVSKTKHTELKAHLSNGQVINISEDDVRVTEDWKQYPEERRAAQHDYGVILLGDEVKIPGDFGFSLPLSLADRLDCELSVNGYRVTSDHPLTSTGPCVNPIIHDNQLEYMIETEGGISGSPVWVGYKSQPTVVAIHNYGPKIKNSHYGSKGTRINLKCLRNIFDWTGVDMTPKLLRAIDPESKLVVPSLRLIYWAQDSAFRVIVDEVDEPAETMLISVFPVYAGPTGANHIKSGYGFMQTRPDGWLRWLSWNPPPASTT
ncbi:uncharacterized protein TRIVIDRAFT_205870 [Trichoderma virens Gv29-8]|uniref:Serine protease n=1 Tax=Hypocrea virens (strain Gv29-8 / FGSC 10586) TaxID=413071 RepID=G9N8G3_HYPVG|nr:uncharacterized protein TRIVIDRAFT_205870 [Trichoderma virens Gv29-8]EHK17271.1 hypothetical protein TRIVIDRAFT_205870 [Trichoderma virens Gv29-8]